MTARVFAGDMRVDAISADDRGIAYGDGVFETMRAHGGRIPWWDAHVDRLQQGAARLRIVLPDLAKVHEEALELLSGEDAVLKLIVTRGRAGRGYAPDAHAAPTWLLSSHSLPAAVPSAGVSLRWCQTRLSLQPILAGIKHCNRLEQVLARAEWDDPAAADRDAFEGLMRSTGDDVVSATAANLFVLREGRWLTPRIDRCGVAGICRAWVLAELREVGLPVDEARLGATAVESADAVFLCNAVRGILPVARLGQRVWPPHPQVAALQRRLALAHPGFVAA